MKLKQIVTVNGQELVNVSNDIFGQLMIAQQFIGTCCPELGSTWLQERPDLREIMGRLFHCGRASVFSLEEKVRVQIEWMWAAEVVEMVETPKLPDPRPALDFSITTFNAWRQQAADAGYNFYDNDVAWVYFTHRWDIVKGPTPEQWKKFSETGRPDVIDKCSTWISQI